LLEFLLFDRLVDVRLSVRGEDLRAIPSELLLDAIGAHADEGDPPAVVFDPSLATGANVRRVRIVHLIGISVVRWSRLAPELDLVLVRRVECVLCHRSLSFGEFWRSRSIVFVRVAFV